MNYSYEHLYVRKLSDAYEYIFVYNSVVLEMLNRHRVKVEAENRVDVLQGGKYEYMQRL